jgi:hypothetical protein
LKENESSSSSLILSQLIQIKQKKVTRTRRIRGRKKRKKKKIKNIIRMLISYLMIILAKNLAIVAAFSNNNLTTTKILNLNFESHFIENTSSNFKSCNKGVLDCCNNGGICSSQCNSDCPCQCPNWKNVVNQTNVSPIKTPSILSTEVSFSAYTLILSIGLPSVSIILIICTLLTITYCCKSRSSNDSSNFNNDVPISVSNLSLVYINLDENNNNNNITKEPPPKYSDYIKSSIVDKLPSYKSFRIKAKEPASSPSPLSLPSPLPFVSTSPSVSNSTNTTNNSATAASLSSTEATDANNNSV